MGKDTNSGTANTAPFLTIQKAAALTNPGDTVYVMDGSYGPFTISRSGSAAGYITYAAYPGQHPTINKTAKTWNGISLSAAPNALGYIIVDGFSVVGNAQSITLQQALAGADYNNTTNGNCIGIDQGAHHIIIRNNTLSYCPGGGIVASGDYLQFYGNVIHHNAFWSPLDTSGFTIVGKSMDGSTAAKIFIHENVLYDNQNLLCNKYQTNPCKITDGEGLIVDSNKNNGYAGRIEIYNNIAYGNGGPGFEVLRSQHIDLINNTSYGNNVSAAAPAPFTGHAAGGDVWISSSSDVNALNNAVYGSPNIPLTAITSDTALDWDYNILFGGLNPKAVGTHDQVADPLFIDAASANFHLQSGSPAAQGGTSYLAPDQDADGVNRPPASISRGAYQF